MNLDKAMKELDLPEQLVFLGYVFGYVRASFERTEKEGLELLDEAVQKAKEHLEELE